MMNITDDVAHNALIAEPSGKLARKDFVELTERFNKIVNETDRIPNLVIHTPEFPGWADFSALVEHLQFIRSHQKLVDKVALVSDSRVLDVTPKIARHFMTANIRHFPADDLAGALEWTARPDDSPSQVKLMKGLPDDVVGIEVRGVITARDYSEQIVPVIEEKLKSHKKIKLLYMIGPEFKSFTPGAVWSDARVGIMHLTQFSKIAVVSDLEWIRHGTRVFAPLIPGHVHVFADSELKDAMAWISD
jgi:hypothetical protein